MPCAGASQCECKITIESKGDIITDIVGIFD